MESQLRLIYIPGKYWAPIVRNFCDMKYSNFVEGEGDTQISKIVPLRRFEISPLSKFRGNGSQSWGFFLFLSIRFHLLNTG